MLLGGVLALPATVVSVLFILPIPGYLIGSALSSVMASRYSTKTILNLGLVSIVIGSLVVLIPGLFGATSAVALTLGAAIYFLGTGVIYPAAITGAIAPIPNHAGTGGAVLGGMQNLIAGLATLLASLVPAPDQMPLGMFMLFMSCVAAYGLLRVNSNQSRSDQMPLAV